MVQAHPLGMQVIYAVLLFNNHRRMLREESGREESLVARSTSDLWKPYKPERYYYEVIERSRRILLARVVIFIHLNSVLSQIAVSVVIPVVFVRVCVQGLSPVSFVMGCLDNSLGPWHCIHSHDLDSLAQGVFVRREYMKSKCV